MFGVSGMDFFFISFFIIFILILGMFVYGIVKSFANSRKKSCIPHIGCAGEGGL